MILNLRSICILSFNIFFSVFFFSAFFYSLKLITNEASELFTIFIIKENTKKDGLKTSRSIFNQKFHIETTYIFMGERVQTSLSVVDQI